MVEETADPPRLNRAAQQALAVWRRLPFTTTVVVIMLVAGLLSGALWRAAADAPWYPYVGYGVPSLGAGRWWTPLTGAFVALKPWYFLPMIASFALLVGWAEYWMGTRLAAAVTVLGHLFAVLGTALFLVAVQGPDWAWSVQTAQRLDVGFSAGAVAAGAVATAMLRPPWRLRVRLALAIYVLVAAVYVGSPADLERFLAVAAGLALGPRLTRGIRPPVPSRPSRREWRLIAVAGLLMVALIRTVTYFLPNDGPLGPTLGSNESAVDVGITLLVTLLLVRGLRHGKRVTWWFAVVIAGLNVAVGLLAAVAGVLAATLGGVFDLDDGIPRFAADELLWTAVFVVLIVGRRAFRVPSRRRVRRSAASAAIDQPTAVQMLQEHGGGTLSWMTTWPENSYFRDGESFVAYQRHAGVAIGLGDPVGPAADRAEAVRAYATMCERNSWVPCLFSATEPTVDAAEELGWQRVQVAEDTLVDLPDLQFRGKSWQDVRSALNKAGKQGITFRMATLAEERWSLVAQVRAISEEWVGDKALPEMGFTLGGVDEALDPHVRVGLAEDADGQVQGVTSWLPVYGGGGQVRGWTLDVMRRRHDGTFRPVVEFLIASSCLTFQSEGAQFVSLSGAPLARAAGDEATAALDRLLDTLGEMLEPMYGFRSLHAFKTKFAPRYEPMYLVFRDEADLPRIGIALTRAYLPDTPLRELVRIGRR
jgi:phosphatidylglycerol lysyltransferase-like protein